MNEAAEDLRIAVAAFAAQPRVLVAVFHFNSSSPTTLDVFATCDARLEQSQPPASFRFGYGTQCLDFGEYSKPRGEMLRHARVGVLVPS